MTAPRDIAAPTQEENRMTELQEKAGALVEAPERAPATAVTPMQMLQVAVERGANLDQLQKLMDLQERWEAKEAEKAFVTAKAAFKAEAPKLTKNKHVGFDSRRGGDRTDYNHATLDHIADELSPVLSQRGLSYSWETEQAEGGLIRVTCILTHVMGHSERVSLQAGPDQSGNKNSIQAVGSTVTYLQRYTLLAATGMATADQDSDGMQPVEFIDAEQKERLIALMKEVDADVPKFLKYLGVDAIDELPASAYDDAVAALEKKRKGNG